MELFVKRSVPENFQWENFSGQVPTESLRTQDSENVYERWVQQMFDPVLVGRSWVSAAKWGPLAKLWGVQKKCISAIFEFELPNLNHLLPQPPFATHILNRLDVRIHQEASKIYHTYKKLRKSRLSDPVFLAIFGHF